MSTKEHEFASMSWFIDFALATGTSRIQLVADHKRHRDSLITDFYRPFRETLSDAWARKRDHAAAFRAMLAQTTDARALRIFPELVEGHRRFVADHPGLRYFEPASAVIPVTPGFGVGVNPELGLIVNGTHHHLKLWLRSEVLTQRRVDFSIAMMSRLPIPADHSVAVLDLRRSRLHYLAKQSASAGPWRKLELLVTAEAAAYAAAWTSL